MRKQLITVLCAAGLVAAVQAQSSTEPSSGSSPGSSSSSSESSGFGKQLSATGRMGHHEARASQLTGSEVTSSSGQTLGTINDVIINPSSGRIDFAVISLSAGASGGAAASSSSSSGEKLVAVPWALLRPSGGMSGSYSPTGSSSGTPSATGSSSGSSSQQLTFVFRGDQSKLESAPSFSQSNWPDISQPSWRQSIFSYFGMSPASATGGAESPEGSSSGGQGSSSSPQGSSSGQGSSSSPSSSSSSSGGQK